MPFFDRVRSRFPAGEFVGFLAGVTFQVDRLRVNAFRICFPANLNDIHRLIATRTPKRQRMRKEGRHKDGVRIR